MSTETTPSGVDTGVVVMDDAGRVRLTRGGATMASLLRIGLGLLYLWAFISQGFGVHYSNTDASAVAAGTSTEKSWNFDYDADAGWITSGFSHSPTEGYTSGLDGPLATIPKDLPTGLVDFLWIFALAGLGIGLTTGTFMLIAGWGGFALNIIIWLSNFPPSSNPLIDGEHMAFAFGILLLMYLHAGNHWGLGRWWSARTPKLLH